MFIHNWFKREHNLEKKSSFPKEFPEIKFYFRDGALDLIKKIKGWKNDGEVAKGLGLTAGLISQIKSEKQHVSDAVMGRICWALGNMGEKWGHLFEPRVTSKPIKTSNPRFNMAKFRGEVPYEDNSEAAGHRSLDRITETKGKKLDNRRK